ncbi:phosphoribosylanthranilate isomerase [Persephonella sp.]|nr:phosphoribosylanthranilate isomerase [Aquificota bacterium]
MKEYILKICGLTDRKQAEETAQAGATHIGMIFFEKSPRHVPLEVIGEISAGIKGRAISVAVTVNQDLKILQNLLDVVDMVQLHGEEPVGLIRDLPEGRVIKALRIKDEKDLEKVELYGKTGVPVLIDAYSEKAYGGTGKQIEPQLAKKAVDIYPMTVLSGGLSPENVGQLLEQIRPAGVDASSKLEVRPGVKDMTRVKKFIDTVRDFYESDNKAD